jgi:ribonuclease HII
MGPGGYSTPGFVFDGAVRLVAHLEWERTCWRDAFRVVVGLDEAGRGALAGPIVAAAVVLPPNLRLTARVREINDSKQVAEPKRSQMAKYVKAIAVSWSIGQATATEIDEFGISRANRLCMERAIEGLRCSPDFALVDAITCELDVPQVGLIDGDAISISIAAASILAKTERDAFMRKIHEQDDRYAFDRHVGYGTELHISALRQHGPSIWHRLTFSGVLPESRL